MRVRELDSRSKEWPISSSNMPMFRIPLAMHTGDNDDFLVKDTIEERIGKPVKKCAPSITMNDWEPVWMLSDDTKNETYFIQTLITQARALRFVPEKGVFNIRRSSWTEDRRRHYCCRPRIWRTTSSQGIPSTSPRSISSRR